MVQPDYTWWPWQFLAAAVGLGAMLVGALVINGPDGEKTAMSVTLAVFAGGNAVILGAAMGDLGRTVVALLVALAAASVACLMSPGWILLAPFVIVPATTSALSSERTASGFISSAILGFIATLRGTILGAFTALLFMVPTVFLFRNRSDALVGGIFAVAAITAVVVGNVFLIWGLFDAATRVSSEQQRRGISDEPSRPLSGRDAS